MNDDESIKTGLDAAELLLEDTIDRRNIISSYLDDNKDSREHEILRLNMDMMNNNIHLMYMIQKILEYKLTRVEKEEFIRYLNHKL